MKLLAAQVRHAREAFSFSLRLYNEIEVFWLPDEFRIWCRPAKHHMQRRCCRLCEPLGTFRARKLVAIEVEADVFEAVLRKHLAPLEVL